MNTPKKLHIIFLDFDDIQNPLLAAGQARATVEVGKRLALLGHKITVISSRYPGSKDRLENGIFYKHIGIGTGNIRVNNLFYILLLPFTVMQLKGDIVIECFTAPISTLFSPLFTRIPVVALPSSFEADRFAKLYHFPFQSIENFGMKFYKYYTPFTKYFDEKLKKRNKQVISKIIPEGVDDEFFKIEKQKAEHILFLGRLDMSQKGIDLLLHSYKKAEKELNFPLVIAGNGPDEDKVKSLIEKLDLNNKVTMTGPTYGKKKDDLMSKSLFVAFSSRHETFSCFALEALATGLPLAAFDIPGLSWTSDEVVFKSKAFSVDNYAQLLIDTKNKLMKNPLTKEARSFARKFSWEQVVSDFESFFYQIIEIEREKKEDHGK